MMYSSDCQWLDQLLEEAPCRGDKPTNAPALFVQQQRLGWI